MERSGEVLQFHGSREKENTHYEKTFRCGGLTLFCRGYSDRANSSAPRIRSSSRDHSVEGDSTEQRQASLTGHEDGGGDSGIKMCGSRNSKCRATARRQDGKLAAPTTRPSSSSFADQAAADRYAPPAAPSNGQDVLRSRGKHVAPITIGKMCEIICTDDDETCAVAARLPHPGRQVKTGDAGKNLRRIIRLLRDRAKIRCSWRLKSGEKMFRLGSARRRFVIMLHEMNSTPMPSGFGLTKIFFNRRN